MRSYAILKNTGETIVKEHRDQVRINENAYTPADLGFHADRARRCRVVWYRAVNWGTVLEGLCWAIVCGALAYLGIVLVAPFGFQIFGK